MVEKAYHPWLKSYPPGIRWDVQIPKRPLFMLLDEAENRYGTHTAIDFLGQKTTYAELADQVRRLASGLRGIGVGKGVKVGLFMPNCPQFVASYYAVLKAGGTVVNYNPLYSPPELKHQINDSATEIMITLALNATYPKVAACLGNTKLKHIVVSEFQEALPMTKRMLFGVARKKEIAQYPDDKNHTRYTALLASEDKAPPVTIHPEDDIAVLQYTGGTTGVPKGAVLTHANLYANTLQAGAWFESLKLGQEVMVGALPLFHVFAMATVMNLSIHTGTAMLLHPRFDMKGILYDIQFKRPTLMPGVPTMYAAILNHKDIGKYDLTSLKMCISGGGPLPMEVKKGFEEKTGCKLIEGYGLTESSPVACANPLFGVNKAGSIGIPFPGTIMDIRDMENPDKVLPQGEVGEICIRGPQVMRGYYHQMEETQRVLRNGVLHTGDIGKMDDEGYFFVVDRLKEMIISGGYKIYPRNIEEILYQHPGVLEAAVIGVDHPSRVHAPKAFIVKKEGAAVTEQDIRDHLRSHISGYAMPHAIEFRDALPKSAIGKILKKELVAQEKAKAGKHLSVRNQEAFTLIELSIVLVIIGLIVGGILVGQDLIKAAEGRAQISQIEKYNQAVNTFRTKFNAIPGDMSVTTANQFGFTPGNSCNGTALGWRDGNGIIDGWAVTTLVEFAGETGLFWMDISSPVAGNLVDINSPSSGAVNVACIPGGAPVVNLTPGSTYIGDYLPAGKIGHGTFVYVYDTSGFNWYGLAAIISSNASGAMTTSASIPVIQAYNMDKKIDDGLPAAGSVQALYINGSSTVLQIPNAQTNDTLTSCYNTTSNAYSISSLANYGGNGNCALSFRFQ